MIVYLAGGSGEPQKWALRKEDGGFDFELAGRTNFLGSYFYVDNWHSQHLHDFKSFLLDSGAFSFLYAGKRPKLGWEDYVRGYSRYISEHDVHLFMELDIDDVIGYEGVKTLRAMLERETSRRCIPVWHVSRGLEEWRRMCGEYEYVAIGGLAGGAGRKRVYKYLHRLTDIAHEYGVKVHGLGCSSPLTMNSYGFDTVDSTSWMMGAFTRTIYRWNGATMDKMPVPSGKKVLQDKVARHNFTEYVKMSEDMEGGGV